MNWKYNIIFHSSSNEDKYIQL